MMDLSGEALVLTARPHGEHGAVVRFLLEEGLHAGFVPGARGRRLRAILHPGNRVALLLRARTAEQLPRATIELVETRALIDFSPMGAAVLGYLAGLLAATLAEGVAHPRLFRAADALLAGLAAEMAAPDAAAALVRLELLLLEEAGFGLDLAHCALGGDAGDLAFVSPKSGRAVSRAMAEGQPWRQRLLVLPRFLVEDDVVADAGQLRAGLRLAGFFLERHLLRGPGAEAPRTARARATTLVLAGAGAALGAAAGPGLVGASGRL